MSFYSSLSNDELYLYRNLILKNGPAFNDELDLCESEMTKRNLSFKNELINKIRVLMAQIKAIREKG